ncbi:restriction endonuclease [Clostridium chromiireducens]|uniref:Restriction endonuclease n=1 Tax=Clostridium chromiireducens TaxID=225345 RepID=A0A964RQH7_9CLOT|nr:restriction endonuclease subunit S [Clostridium chromiireducens]MVX65728.1 restriction endonuclease [Clostridium chromiireducens]
MNAQDLKNSILQLAIQGKLVEQRQEEGNAKELIKEIKAEKERLIKEKKIKKEKPLAEIAESDIPFEIPESWEWVRFGDIVNYNMGKTPPRSDDKYWGNDFNWVSIADMIPNGYIDETNEKVSNAALKEKFNMNLVPKGTLLMSFKLTIGRVSILNINAVHNEAIISIYPYGDSDNIIRDYLFSILPIISTYGDSKGAIKGKTLNSTSLSNLLVPIPSLDEQKRIVTKIEALIPYIEKYGEAHSKLEIFNKKFPEDMQKSILQYAIQGKLVEQREEEGTAEELYKQIQEEKEKLINEKKIKKEKPLAEITEDEVPFEIPESWKWVRLGNLFSVSTGLTPAKTNPLFHENGDIPWITSSQTGELKIEKANNFITKFAIENTNIKIYPKHTLLIAMYGQGKTRGQISELLIDATINQACAALENIVAEENLRKYILYFQIYNYDVSRTGAEGSAQPNLNLDKVRNILVPLPPLEEQKRIVARIEEMLPYCKQLVK